MISYECGKIQYNVNHLVENNENMKKIFEMMVDKDSEYDSNN